MSVATMISYKLHFSSCDNSVGFCKSSHNYAVTKYTSQCHINKSMLRLAPHDSCIAHKCK